ncbi:MAG TPA: D-alanyl-D-alanine carboxypeptidase family protein [Clostridia bacterium]|nr:D-alanyl-D-alanine carboxypeptidase family protein [Clostridia bacterium]
MTGGSLSGLLGRYRCIVGVAVAILLLFRCAPVHAQEEAPETGAAGAVLIEANTRMVLMANEAHKKLPMASTTKIMTALVAIEHCSLDEMAEVPAEAYGAEGSSMYLQKGEKLSMRDLLYGLMLVSGNDAAITIAVHVGGSVAGFAALMNAKAKELGALNTNFVTPNGLPDDEHYTTAYDLAIITAAAMRQETFSEIVSATYYRTTTGTVPRTLKNKNKILWEYPGGCGVKTGYTKAAGKCLVFAAERDGMMLIGVVLNCSAMFESAQAMLDYGFDQYELATVVKKGEVVARISVDNGMKNALALVAKEDIIIPIKKGESAALSTRVECPALVAAPVEEGTAIGRAYVLSGTKALASTELIAEETVDSRSYFEWLKKLSGRWTA